MFKHQDVSLFLIIPHVHCVMYPMAFYKIGRQPTSITLILWDFCVTGKTLFSGI